MFNTKLRIAKFLCVIMTLILVVGGINFNIHAMTNPEELPSFDSPGFDDVFYEHVGVYTDDMFFEYTEVYTVDQTPREGVNYP